MNGANQNKTAVIIASRPVSAGMRRYVPPGAFVIAADAGWQNAAVLGLTVHLAVGDFDSAPPPTHADEVIRLPAEKDDTDTHFAARCALERGYKNIVMLGVQGGRADHAVANLQTMLMLAKAGARVMAAADEGCVWCFGPGELWVEAAGWRWLSVFAAGGPARGVYERGVKYPLTDATLTPDMPLGVSNEFAGARAHIRCEEGFLYVFVSSREA